MELDYLTGLLPLHIFMDEADKVISANPDKHYAVTATDLSNFKYINDIYGLPAGNAAIKLMADIFFINNPRCVMASRPYADQFRALIDIGDNTLEQEVDYITQCNRHMVELLTERYPNVFFHIYTGLYIFGDKTESCRFANDKAHFAKKCIKGNLSISCGIFDPKQFQDFSQIMTVTNLFQYAKNHHSIDVYFQPKFSAKHNRMIGAEALGRIRDDKGMVVSPAFFIPVLEKTGMIGAFDDIIMELTFQHMRRWLDNNVALVPISLNVSRIQFLKTGFIEKLLRLTELYRIPHELVEIEITETTFIDSMDLITNYARRLHSLNFKISVDDFGSGYSSLSLIASLPADIIKLDCSFARKCIDTEQGRSILLSIIPMLLNLNFDIICEGIETLQQLETITELGCDKIQGYYYDKPLPVTEFETKYFMAAAPQSFT